MLINRTLTTHLQRLGKYFPILSLTGPRQAGKTTLLKALYADYQYLSLENPDVREQATEDPRSFLRLYNDRVIFDEVQRAPELFSYLQEEVDNDRRPGRFVLSGSQNFLLRKNITQSLAGRVGIAFLFPLDLVELSSKNLRPASYEEAIFKGFYPAIFSEGIPSDLFYPSYEYSYIERDVSGLISANNLTIFRQFIRVCATYAGQLVNYATIARACGINTNTVRNWLSILEQSFIIFHLPPYYKNFGKRLVKSPKLYFYDTGLLCHLLRVTSASEVMEHRQRGTLFENLIIAERFKRTQHLGKQAEYYFFRDNNGLEVDLLHLDVNKLYLTEVKSTRTFKSQLANVVHKVAELSDMDTEKSIVYGGEESFVSKEVAWESWYS